MNKGILYGITVYVLWGFFPIYWKLLSHVPALQLLGHRIAWSFLVLLGVIFITKQWSEFRATLNARHSMLGLLLKRVLAILSIRC